MRALTAALVAAVLTAACAGNGGEGGTVTPDPTPGPTVNASETTAATTTPSAPATTAEVTAAPSAAAVDDLACADASGSEPGAKAIATSDFSDASAWGVDDASILHVDESCLAIVAAAAGETVEAVPEISELGIGTAGGGQITGLRKVALEVDVAPVGAPEGSFFGLVCGVDPRLRFYLGVGAEGTAVIAEANRDAIETIAAKAGRVEPATTGRAVRLRAECDVGSFEAVFAVYANGKKLLTKKVGNLDILDRSGTFEMAGVVAGAGTGPTQTSFDDFTVHEVAP